MTERVGHLVVVGVGLIGGSFARALREAGRVERITGVGRDPGHLARARRLGVIDAATTDVAAAVASADVVMVAVPMGAYERVLGAVGRGLRGDTVVTDAGSTKRHAILLAGRLLPDESRFVPGHPIAGTEHSGVEASNPRLFEGRLAVLTPTAKTDPSAIARVAALWRAAGAHVHHMSPEEHDRVLAGVSHLPHLAAYALVRAVLRMRREDLDPLDFAAGGFRDFTRIASSSPDMWRDIALTNRDALLGQLDALADELGTIRRALSGGDGERLLACFREAKAARDAWLARLDSGTGEKHDE